VTVGRQVVREQVMLSGYTTLGLGGPAARFVEAGHDDEIAAAVRAADLAGDPVLVLGGGSNLVVADAGFPGTVVLAAFAGFEVAGVGPGNGNSPVHASPQAEVTVAAGQDWDELVRQCVSAGLSGIECLSGIPGLAGATPIQNVGAYGQEVAQTIASVRAYDRLRGEVVELSGADCGFGYRTSMFKRDAAAALAAEAGLRSASPMAGAEPHAGSLMAGAAPQVGSLMAGAAAQAGSPIAGAAPKPAPHTAGATGRFVILSVTFVLTASALSAPVRYGELGRSLGVAEGDRVPLADARHAVLELRRGKGMVLDDADADTHSAGSFFTNPVLTASQFDDLEAVVAARWDSAGDDSARPARVPYYAGDHGLVKVPAAWLIEHAGFTKGFALSRDSSAARISAKHTLALINPGRSTTAELLRLARHIRDGVRAAFGVELAAEPTLVGAEL
jgi:UDP-N-acetylmuramate dehydrogenase